MLANLLKVPLRGEKWNSAEHPFQALSKNRFVFFTLAFFSNVFKHIFLQSLKHFIQEGVTFFVRTLVTAVAHGSFIR